MMRRPAPRQAGFTLVEAVIAMAIIGIIGAIVAVFIRVPVQNYADSVAVAEVSDEADLALRRMTRELRLALPNSMRVNADGSAIEFLLSKTGGRYLALEDNLAATYPILDFSTSARTLTVLGTLSQAVNAGDYFVVYNLGGGMAPADAWGFAGADRNIARISNAVAANTALPVLTLDDNPFASQSVSMPSPDRRFQIVSGPVTFACARAADGALVLTRYAGYAINASQVNPPVNATSVAPLSRRLNGCAGLFAFDTAGSAQRTSLVTMTLELAPRAVGAVAATGLVRLVQQVHVDNTP
jgi:MSHA biogenesis protein MshO